MKDVRDIPTLPLLDWRPYSSVDATSSKPIFSIISWCLSFDRGFVSAEWARRTEPNRTEHLSPCSVRFVFGLLNEPEMSVRFDSVWYEQRWIQFVFVLFSQFIRSSRMLGKLYVPGKKCAEFALHNIIPNHTEHEPNIGSDCSVRFVFARIRTWFLFGSPNVRFGSVRLGSVRRAHSVSSYIINTARHISSSSTFLKQTYSLWAIHNL